MRLRSGQQADGAGKPRILFVSHTARWAGPTNSLLLLLRGLRDRFDMRVLMPGEGAFSDVLGRERFPFTSLPNLSKRAIPGILRVIRNHQIDLVYANNTSGACRNALIAAKLARVRSICHIREMGRPETRRRFLFLRLADATVAVSEACAASVPGFRGKARYVVYNGIERIEFTPDKAMARAYVDATTNTKANVPIIISVSHLSERKGQEHAVRALAQLAGHGTAAQLLLVGSSEFDPGYADRVRNLARDLGIESQVVFAGFRSDVARLLQGADLFLHSASRDPHPRAVLEAMAAGLPIVGFAVDGVGETVVPGENGELAPAGDVDALTTAAAQILRDPELGVQLGRRGQHRVARCFSAERAARAVGTIIESTVVRHTRCRVDGPLRVGPGGPSAAGNLKEYR
jgi:glycosyltransferase involved in cell wall biosynthesis